MTEPKPAAPKRPRRRAAAKPAPDVASTTRAKAADVEAVPSKVNAPAIRDRDPASTAPATVIRVERGGIAEATAGAVDVRMGGIGRLDAEVTSSRVTLQP